MQLRRNADHRHRQQPLRVRNRVPDLLWCRLTAAEPPSTTMPTKTACVTMAMNSSVAPMLRPATTTLQPTTDTDNSLCVFPTGCQTCSGETDGSGTTVDNDADQDGVCDHDEILTGCTDASLPATTTQRRPPTPTTASACSQQGARPALVRPTAAEPPSTTMPTRMGCAMVMNSSVAPDAAACNYDATADHRHRQQPLRVPNRLPDLLW